MNQQIYKDLISGKKEGPLADFIRLILKGFSYFYVWVVNLRNFLYDKNILKTRVVSVPVISIGNLTAGGTGKTPTVIWCCNFLSGKKYRCAILTRGYKAKPGKLSDEPAILTKNCPATRVVVNPNRYEGARKAINRFHCNAIVMDDGFQHRKLARDIDIAVIDATNPFGYGKMLPAGLLREPVSSLKRAQAVILTRADQVDNAKLQLLEKKIKDENPDLKIAHAQHEPICGIKIGQKEITIEELRNRKVFAFCGIGNPESFLNTLKKLDINVVGHRFYNDHHNFTKDEFIDIYEEARYHEADIILSTQKDWTKTILFWMNHEKIEFAYLKVEIKFTKNEDSIKGLIEDTLSDKISG